MVCLPSSSAGAPMTRRMASSPVRRRVVYPQHPWPRPSARDGGERSQGREGECMDGNRADPRALDRPDRVDALIEYLLPTVDDILRRLEGDEFTTSEFIDVLLTDPDAEAAYREALVRWGEGERYAK